MNASETPKRVKKTKLTVKQLKFVAAYLGEANGNGVSAARIAGYSGTDKALAVVAAQNIRKPSIAGMLQSKLKNYGASAEFVIKKLMDIAGADPRKYYNEDGSLIPVPKLGDAEAAALGGMDVEEIFAGSGEDRAQIGNTRKIKRIDPVKALELLGKYLAIFTEKLQVDVDASNGPLVMVLPREYFNKPDPAKPT